MNQNPVLSPLQLDSISKAFDGRSVLNNVNITLEQGEIFGLIGLNGMGKTTMIKIILGLLDADNGSGRIFGQDISDHKAREGICFLPEKFSPSIYFKGFEFIKLATAYHNVSPANDDIIDMARRLDLNPEALGSRVGRYSKGMGQKLGLMSALLSKARLLILDEPMSGLDPKARILLKNEMLNYRNNGGSIFFSSHILADLEEICDRIAILHDTSIIYTGKPGDFIGTYNPGRGLEKAFLTAIS